MKAKLIGESSCGMTAIEIYNDQGSLVWSNIYFDDGCTNDGYITGMCQVFDDMIKCNDVDQYDGGCFEEYNGSTREFTPIFIDTALTTGVICEYDGTSGEWAGGDYGLGQSTEIAAALMLSGKLPVDDDVIATYEGDKVVYELIKKLNPGHVIVYDSSDAPGGVKLVGSPEDCTLEYSDAAIIFDTVEEAQAYINEHEPNLD